MYKILLVVHFPQTFQHNFFQHNFNYQAVEYLEKFLYIELGKRLLISWLQSSSAVILEPQKIKSATVSTVSPSICHEVLGPDCMILVF